MGRIRYDKLPLAIQEYLAQNLWIEDASMFHQRKIDGKTNQTLVNILLTRIIGHNSPQPAEDPTYSALLAITHDRLATIHRVSRTRDN